MICTVCHLTIGDCTCPEKDDQLRAMAHSPKSHVMFKWCRACDKHYARCRCETPDFYVLARGKEVDGPFTSLAGGRVMPDLTKR